MAYNSQLFRFEGSEFEYKLTNFICHESGRLHYGSAACMSHIFLYILINCHNIKISVYNFNKSFTLQNGVRGLMLDMHDYHGDIWLCRGPCTIFTAFVRDSLNFSD